MEHLSVESYLKNMKLKKKMFGGYDPEDVILKMQELVKLARETDSGAQLEEYRRSAETALKEQAQKCRQAEAALAELQQKSAQPQTELQRQLEEAKAAAKLSESRRVSAEASLAQLENELQELKSGKGDYSGDADRLHELLTSLEKTKESIVQQYTRDAMKEAETARRESAVLTERNTRLQQILSEQTHALAQAAEGLVQKAQQIKDQVTTLEQANEQSGE